MIDKLYRIIFWVFTFESIFILIGINLNIIDYGVDLQTPFMMFGIMLGLIINSIVYFIIGKINDKSKNILELVISTIMIFLCFYYLFEDKFSITI